VHIGKSAVPRRMKPCCRYYGRYCDSFI